LAPTAAARVQLFTGRPPLRGRTDCAADSRGGQPQTGFRLSFTLIAQSLLVKEVLAAPHLTAATNSWLAVKRPIKLELLVGFALSCTFRGHFVSARLTVAYGSRPGRDVV
jgi:hypothetical protein